MATENVTAMLLQNLDKNNKSTENGSQTICTKNLLVSLLTTDAR